MLGLMRKHAKSWLINMIIAAIVVVFIFWGVGSFRERRLSRVAVVNEEPITLAEFQETHRQLYQQVRAQYGEDLSEELLQSLDLKRQALGQLINRRLLAQRARAMGVEVSEAELQAEIMGAPLFQMDGQFNTEKYRRMLTRLGYTPEGYEELTRRDLVIRKLTRLITGLAKVSPSEARSYFHFTDDKVEVEFVRFKPEDFRKKVEVTPEELRAYFEKNKERYRVPPQVKVAYLAFRAQDFENEVSPTEEELAQAYEFNRDQYHHPEQVKARHILFRLAKDAPPPQVAQVRARALSVLKQARAGADFAALARKYSEGPAAEEGGALGWFARDQMVEPFAQAAFALAPGEISEPVRTQFGLHLVKVEARRPAGTETFEEVREEIARKLVREKAREMATDRALEAFDQATLSRDFKDTAARFGLRPVRTGFFSADDPVGDLGLHQEFNQAALSLEAGEIGPLVDLPDGHYLLKCLERKASYLPSFEEALPAVKVDLEDEKAAQAAKEAAQAFLAALQKEPGRWEHLLKERGLSAETTGSFTRGGLIPKIGQSPDLTAAAFALERPGEVAPEVYQSGKAFYLIRLKEKLTASEEDFAREKQNLTRALQERKGQAYLAEWLQAARAQAKIKIEEGLL